MDERYTLIDGYALQAAYPETWTMPNLGRVTALQPGDIIKIGVMFDPTPMIGEDPEIRRVWTQKIGKSAVDYVNGERFWLQVTSIYARWIGGYVTNELLYTAHHGLQYGDSLQVERRHILDVWEGPCAFHHQQSA